MNDFKEYSIVISKLDTGYEVPTDLKIWNNYVGYKKYLGMIYQGKRALVSTENKVWHQKVSLSEFPMHKRIRLVTLFHSLFRRRVVVSSSCVVLSRFSSS